ncbi:hypothetical protein K461DRAFT_314721 [Myriangium duriaei CBS 260.36]|uniref:Amidohydrolase-related domain-containing protein n=1 Tax=Myriangium duriaei CBS 260.36 TaxID=1168546 RepID=A0A9P4J1N6_9PEZI|nr:hypothetical protein K461DRAFT_314721 [Myriangium duriaei CBS 260.36]
MPETIIDSHIHLWPESAANAEGHAWMAAVPSLAKQHLLQEYLEVARTSKNSKDFTILKVVYIETDRRYSSDHSQPLEEWASGPLNEIKFLRSIIEGHPEDATMLGGIVLWAPMHCGEAVFDQWLKLAEQTAGELTWQRVQGFRFLLQAITSRSEFEKLVFSQDFIRILRKLGTTGKGFTFDVGIDQHNGGAWQLEVWKDVLSRVFDGGPNRPTTIIMSKSFASDRKFSVLNDPPDHLCKPNMTRVASPSNISSLAEFTAWQECIRNFASYPSVYMKLSGAFSEMSKGRVDSSSVDHLASQIRPWVDTVFDAFRPGRIMFGSDWPVCNIRGPAEDRTWPIWKAIVTKICDDRGLGQGEKGLIFGGTAAGAYHLQTE